MRIALIVLLLFFLISCAGGNSDVAKIQQVFKAYHQSVERRDGKTALKLIDKNTFDYYTKILDLCLHADSLELSKLDLVDKFNVLNIKHFISAKNLQQMEPGDLFVSAVQNGLAHGFDAPGLGISNIKVDGYIAHAKLVLDNLNSETPLYFYKELNVWKVDITSTFPASNADLKVMLRNSPMNETEFIETSLEIRSGIKPDRAIWFSYDSVETVDDTLIIQ